jgi:hypothetical protein
MGKWEIQINIRDKQTKIGEIQTKQQLISEIQI